MASAEPQAASTDPGAHEPAERVRLHVRIAGIVQGVGFRPFVHALATRLNLCGHVSNGVRGVTVEVEGRRERVDAFLDALRREPPPLARIERVWAHAVPITGEAGFAIRASERRGGREALIAPDVATCADCLRELFDPADRRFLYPFTNCTNCGPRFTIVRDVPYDRPFTTMAVFDMCAACAREYSDPGDRRFHAQPICCPACGPRVRLIDGAGREQDGDPIRTAADHLRRGRVIAVKGLGGYHLAAAAGDEAAVAALRARKRREERPFAVMVRDLDGARRLAEIHAAEAALLSSSRRPIVVLRRRPGAALAGAVAPGNRFVGLMLPYTPLHHLLYHYLQAPFVLTSGNLSDEPIAYEDEDALARLGAIADLFLCHDREIHTRTDDSVARVQRGCAVSIRRSRGYAPEPLSMPATVSRPILACGAELKNTFCLAKGEYAFVSHHIGDLENFQTLRAFTDGIAHYRQLFAVAPQLVAYDLHPEYLSSKFALALEGVERIGVQHHHAHVAACLAENGCAGPAIGVAFDGLGYGLDGTLWGGEFLIADLARFTRAGHLEPIAMPGGTAAIKEPWRMAASYLDTAYAGSPPSDLAVLRRNRARWAAVLSLIRARINAPLTSSAGRLFDAVAALIGVCDAITYEGQAAIELEQLADPAEQNAYRAERSDSPPYRVRAADIIREVVADLRAGTPAEVIAMRFHNALGSMVADVCSALRASGAPSVVALTGGVFQNCLLLERAARELETRGFRVLTHSQVPANDGGISYGQAVVAAANSTARM
ncbi:MAG: carbamoyltransferase HypF [Candidatus Binatia bacterium]